jgi:hypothetical protein
MFTNIIDFWRQYPLSWFHLSQGPNQPRQKRSWERGWDRMTVVLAPVFIELAVPNTLQSCQNPWPRDRCSK